MRITKKILLTTVIAGLPASMWPTMASAQAGADAAAAEPTDVIIVTGSALARQRALDVKRNDTRIVEALGSDELGQFPDNNIGESLNRIAGVSMLVEKGEGRYVQIRGVAANLNNVTINGLQMGSPEVEDGGRQAPLDIISAGVLNRVEVIKTRTPDMDGQGIGGTVNIVTQSPFDQADSFYGRFSARVGYESIRPRKDGYGGHDPYSIDGTLSGKTADNRLGWLIGGTYTAREYTPIGIFQDDWDTANGEGLPVNVKNNYYVIGRQRLNINAALEWQSDEGSKIYLRSFFGDWNEYQHRNRYEQNFSVGIVPSSATEGVSGSNRVAPNIRLEFAEKQVFSAAFGGETQIGSLTLDGVLQYNRNEIAEPNNFWEWRSGAIFGPNRYVLGDNGVVTITPDAGTPDRLDPALFPLRRVRISTSDLTEEAAIGALNLSWQAHEDLALSAGAKAARTTRGYDFQRTQFDPGTSPLNLGQPGFAITGFINSNPSGSAPNLLMDIEAMDAFLANPANAAFFRENTAVRLANNFSSDYDVRETVLAGYAMGSYTPELFSVAGGVRVERTEVNSGGFLLRAGTATPITNSDSYTTWLPSLIVNFRPTDQWVLRAGVTRALGRPGYNTIAPRSSYDTPSSVVGRLSVGNPGLKPRTAWSYDASIEFYPDRLSSFAVAVFQKDISDDFVASTQSFSGADIATALAARGFGGGAIDTAGITRLDISTTINAGSTKLQGIELIGQYQLGFLPAPFNGLGLSGSATFLKGNTTQLDGSRTPVQGQPKQTLAASIFYQIGGFDAAISYARNASFLTDLNDDPDLSLDQGKFARIDARIAYTFANGLRVFVEGVNLNDEPTSEFQGGRSNWNTEYEYVGRTYYLGVGYRF